MSDFLNFIYGAIGGATALIAITAFFSGKIVEYILNRSIENYKNTIELNSEKIKLSFSLELQVLRELWNYIRNIIEKGSKFSRSDDDSIAKWEEAVQDFEEFLFKNDPYIHSSINELTSKLIGIIEQDGFNPEIQLRELEEIKDLIVKTYQKRLFFS